MDKTGFLEESPGVKSSSRLIFVSGAYSVIAMAGYMVYHMDDPIKIGAFLAAGIAALGGAKYFGTKNETFVGQK